MGGLAKTRSKINRPTAPQCPAFYLAFLSLAELLARPDRDWTEPRRQARNMAAL